MGGDFGGGERGAGVFVLGVGEEVGESFEGEPCALLGAVPPSAAREEVEFVVSEQDEDATACVGGFLFEPDEGADGCEDEGRADPGLAVLPEVGVGDGWGRVEGDLDGVERARGGRGREREEERSE